MARVEWSRLEPGDVEAVVGVMLCREHPLATRVKPSRGDRGVDIYVPDDTGWIVYQVKSFTGKLTSSHKRQITNSWDEFRDLVEEKHLNFVAWYAVRPENPTWENIRWLEALTAGASFHCAWLGLDFLEGLAAKYQDVIDYYLRDGKERLEQTIREFLTLVGAVKEGESGDRALEPSGSFEALESLHQALNRFDPHYRFDFSVETAPESDEFPPIPESEGLVAAVINRAGNRRIVIKVFARFREAVLERPIPGRFEIEAAAGTPEAISLQDFIEYGTPIDILTAKSVAVDLPGGFGGEFHNARIIIGPPQSSNAIPFDLQLHVLDSLDNDTELASADIMMESATTGMTGSGAVRAAGRERHGVFKIEFRLNPATKQMNLSVRNQQITGASPADVLPGLRVLAALHPPNRLLLSVRNGPALGPPMVIPADFLDSVQARRLVEICEALATIQRHTFVPVRVPDFTTVRTETALEWIRVARLLHGEVLKGTWEAIPVTLRPDIDIPAEDQEPFAAALPGPLTVAVSGTVIPLGEQIVQVRAARLDRGSFTTGPEGQRNVTLIPAADNTLTIQWKPT